MVARLRGKGRHGVAVLSGAVFVACATTPILPEDAVRSTAPVATPRPVAKKTSEAKPKASGFARVKHGARIYTSPSTTAEHVVLQADQSTARGFSASRVVRVRGETGAFVEIETLGAKDVTGRCGSSITPLRDYALKLYVRRDQLDRVVTKRTRVDFENGTSVTVEPGAVVDMDLGDDQVSVVIGDYRLPLRIKADRIGRYYPPPTPLSRDPELLDSLDRRARIVYGDRGFELVMKTGRGAWTLTALGAGDHPTVTLFNHCASVVGRVETTWAVNRVGPPGRGGVVGGIPGGVPGGVVGGVIGGSSGGRTHVVYDAPVGIPVYWSDGRAAGTVRKQTYLGADVKRRSGKACFRSKQVGHAPDGRATHFDLCFVQDDLRSREVSDVFSGLSGLSVSGSTTTTLRTGRGGGGTGSGTIGLGNSGLIGGASKKLPMVTQGHHSVSGQLDRDIIRRIVRAHRNEIRYCYAKGLVGDPKLAGNITVDFTIGGDGKVSSRKLGKSNLKNKLVERCVLDAVKNWKFPKPTDGKKVNVSYPFELRSP